MQHEGDIPFHAYDSRAKLAEALAAGVAATLAGGIATRGSATLAVSGGSTPALFFEHLSRAEIDWERVTVTLVDERCVPPDHERSNFRLVREKLARNAASKARLVPLHDGSEALGEAEEAAEDSIALLGPLDAAVLGMGADGHTASFFPGGDRLEEALDPASPRHVVSMRAPGAGEPRLTMTLRTLLQAHFLALHIEGEEKRAVLGRTRLDGPETEMPVRAVLRRGAGKLHIFWAP